MYCISSKSGCVYFRFVSAKTCLFCLIRDFGLCVEELPDVLDFLFDKHDSSCSIELTRFNVSYDLDD